MKTCTKCNTAKNLDEFTKCAKASDGRGSYCRMCHRAYTKAWQENNPERVSSNRKRYNQENAESISAARKVYKAENKQYFLDYARKYAKEKPGKALLYEARKRAKEFGLDFSITDKDVVVPEFCPILGVRLVQGLTDSNRDCCPSLDRVEPSRGYVPGNIAVISYRANRIKNDATAEEHRKIAAWMDSFGTPQQILGEI